MNRSIIKKRYSIFEEIRQTDEDGIEYWSARQLWKILEYTEYRHFLPVIEKAKIACRNSGQLIENHFEDILEMVSIGSGAERPIDSVKLSRYACYLIVQNADPSKAMDNDKIIVDWQNKGNIIGKMKIEIEDYLIDEVKRKYDLTMTFDDMDAIIDRCVDVAKLWFKQ